MRNFIIIVLSICFLACNSKNLINSKNVTKLVLIEMLHQNKETHFIVKNKDSIYNIIKKINKADRDPAVFISEYKIVIYDRDVATKTILCNSKRINIDGITYKMNENLKTVILSPLSSKSVEKMQ